MSTRLETGPVFSSLAGQSRRESAIKLGAGLLANALVLSLLIWVKVPSSEKPQNSPRIQMMSLSRLPELARLPVMVQSTKRPAPKASLLEAPSLSPARSMDLPTPPSLTPTKVELKATLPTVEAPSIPAPKPVIGTFASTAPAPARMEREAVRVATGGFGSSAPSLERKPDTRSGVAHQSGFESAEAVRPGKSRLAVVQGEAFGTSEAGVPKLRTSSTLMAGSFDVSPMSVRRNRLERETSGQTDFKGVEILSKPRPLYTEEARRLGIEGEVHLRILFGADGRLKVLTVVRGLGHGLDENAALAAAQIQFRPASKEGQAVEQAAVVRVQFQLAN